MFYKNKIYFPWTGKDVLPNLWLLPYLKEPVHVGLPGDVQLWVQGHPGKWTDIKIQRYKIIYL